MTRTFESGAIRDSVDGKGRFDLMPLGIMAHVLDDEFIRLLAAYQDSKETANLEEAIKYLTICQFENQYSALERIAKRFEYGAKKYGDDNWRKGIPVNCYLDSSVRHYCHHLMGLTNEDHIAAAAWNVLCAIWTHDNFPELR